MDLELLITSKEGRKEGNRNEENMKEERRKERKRVDPECGSAQPSLFYGLINGILDLTYPWK